MPFLNRRQIALEVRQKAEKQYKAQLRKALSDPTLTAAQRRDLRTRLSQVGQPRVYSADSPPPPGAIPVSRPVKPSEEELRRMKKAELVKLAGEMGLPTSGTKSALIERILTH